MTTAYPGTLSQALADTTQITANHVVYLRAGTYTGDYVSTLIGSGLWLITVKAWPGERAIIDGAFTAWGHNITFQDLEFTYSGWTTRTSAFSGSTPADIPYTKTLAAEGMSLKFINCLIHNQASPAFQSLSQNALFYGCVIYHNGWSGTDRGHGHGLYVQNSSSYRKVVEDCIIFDNFGYGIHAYTESGSINNITLNGCTCFQNGSLYGTNYNDILMGGYTVAQSPIIQDCLTYGGTVNLGYSAGCTGAVLVGNYFPGGIVKTNAQIDTETDNTYNTVGNVSFLRANDYDTNRAHLTIYNEAAANTVTVDVSSLGWTGNVQARNVQDYFNDTQTLTISGGNLTVNMQAINRTVATPIEWTAPATTFPAFGCFVLERIV